MALTAWPQTNPSYKKQVVLFITGIKQISEISSIVQ